jgi:hypothetical protein
MRITGTKARIQRITHFITLVNETVAYEQASAPGAAPRWHGEEEHRAMAEAAASSIAAETSRIAYSITSGHKPAHLELTLDQGIAADTAAYILIFDAATHAPHVEDVVHEFGWRSDDQESTGFVEIYAQGIIWYDSPELANKPAPTIYVVAYASGDVRLFADQAKCKAFAEDELRHGRPVRLQSDSVDDFCWGERETPAWLKRE